MAFTYLAGINIDGYVGIGTATPVEKLQVNGKVYIDTTGVDWNETTPGLTRGSLHFDPSVGTNHVGNAITFGASDANNGTLAHAGIYTRSDGAYGTKMYIATTDSYSSGSKTSIFIDYNGEVTIPRSNLIVAGDLTVNGGDIILVGTGRIQGVDTVSASTDAANKAYVDNAVATIVTPATPTTITTTIVGETIEVAFNQSSTSNIDYYQVWSSDDGADYGIIAQIAPSGFSSTMTIVDSSFYTGGTMSYRVYAVKGGVYSAAGTASRAYTVAALAVTNMSVTNLNTAYYVQYEKPTTRFLDHIEIYMDSETTQGALSRTGATLVYSGQNHSYMYNVSNSNNFHQFWVEVVTT